MKNLPDTKNTQIQTQVCLTQTKQNLVIEQGKIEYTRLSHGNLKGHTYITENKSFLTLFMQIKKTNKQTK
jgi:hypothetical protein